TAPPRIPQQSEKTTREQLLLQKIQSIIHEQSTYNVNIKYHYIREAIQDKALQLEYCPTAEMLADILTKPPAQEKFEKLREKMGLQEVIE
uniref:Uncharacterized protein n=1 Tax=Amphimedon queenslandica TaxID=400682 RepID=A0A1X7SHK1_AMPQE